MGKRIPAGALSRSYQARELGEADIPQVYVLCRGNPQFYRYCPPPVSESSIRRDMRALPPGRSYADKYYLGFFREGVLVAVLDLILGYPRQQGAFIGFFMVDSAYQGRSVGSEIVGECLGALRARGFDFARLAYVKGNRQSETFWKKNGFAPTGLEIPLEGYTEVILQKALQEC